jgi:hypothetical protein
VSTNPPKLNSLRAFLEEHQKLTRRIADLRRWWSELDDLGLRKFGEMASRVQELRDLLAEHFAEEESGGYLSSALAVAPQFEAQAAALGEQHAQFLQRLDHLIGRLQDSETTSNYWRASRAEVEQIIVDLRQHEHHENALVHAAFGDDTNADD